MKDFFTEWGPQLIWFVLSILGALVGVAQVPKMNSAQLWSALGTGFVGGAMVGPQAATLAYTIWAPPQLKAVAPDIPTFITGGVAFIVGFGGMFIVPMLIAFWRNPLGFIAWIRGKTPPPPPPDELHNQGGRP